MNMLVDIILFSGLNKCETLLLVKAKFMSFIQSFENSHNSDFAWMVGIEIFTNHISSNTRFQLHDLSRQWETDKQ